MAPWESRYGIVSQVRNLGLLLGVSFAGESKPEEEFFVARPCATKCCGAASGPSATTRPRYVCTGPEYATGGAAAGLDIMEEAIDAVQRKGPTIGDYPPLPSGNVGF